MQLTNNKGFTLIELIMVIVILGILAAVVVPRFFDFTGQAYDANEEAVIGAIRAGLNLYAADKLINDGARKFPDGDDLASPGDFSVILDEEPDGWSMLQEGGNDNKAVFKYSDPEPDRCWEYESSGNDQYNLTKLGSCP